MKKLVSFALSLILSLTSMMAQEAETPAEKQSVDFVAYFCKGDTMEYRYDELVERIKGQDTIQEQSAFQLFRIVVIDSTATNYRLEVSQLDYSFENKNEFLQESSKCLSEVSKDLKVILLTDEMGAIQHIENWQEIRDVVKKGIAQTFDTLYTRLPQMESVMPRRQLQSTLQLQFATEEGIMSAYPELTMLFALLGKAITTEPVTTDGLNAQGYPTHTKMVAGYSEVMDDTDFEDDYEFNSLSITTIQTKDMVEIGKNTMNMMLSDEASKKVQVDDVMANVEKELGSEIKGVVDECYKYFFNGWPKYAYYDQTISTQGQEKVTTRVVQWVSRAWN